VGFALTEQALLGPLLAEAKSAAAGAAGSNEDAVGPGAQRVFDESRRQLAGTQKVDHGGVGGGQRFGVGATCAGEDDNAGAAGESCQLRLELLAQRIDRLLRHVDAGDENLASAEGRRRRAGPGADPATRAEIGIDDREFQPRPPGCGRMAIAA
jgi:hypothetical protein